MKRYGKFKEKLSFIAEEESIYHARTEGDLLEAGKIRPKIIDLFADAGGMTLGFTKLTGHIFQSVWANDFNAHAAKTYNGLLCLRSPGSVARKLGTFGAFIRF